MSFVITSEARDLLFPSGETSCAFPSLLKGTLHIAESRQKLSLSGTHQGCFHLAGEETTRIPHALFLSIPCRRSAKSAESHGLQAPG